MKKVLVGYPLDKYEEFDELLHSVAARYSLVFRDYDYEWLKRNVHQFDIVIPSLRVIVDDEIIDNAEKLELLFTPTTGRDHIKVERYKDKLKVLTLHDYARDISSINSTAELGFSLILSLSRRIVAAHQDVAELGRWQRNNFLGRELNGKVMGVIGMGRIGQKIAGYAEAFGMKVVYWDKVECGKWKKVPQLNGLISLSDFVVVAIALNSETRHLINLDNIGHFKKGSILVNISRGKVIEEESLCVALRQGILSGVGVDVLEMELEDYTKSPLYEYVRDNPGANAIITPHIGGATIEAWKKVFALVFEKIAEQGVLDGHKDNS